MRLLKIAMVVMGVLIVVGTVTMVALLAQRVSGSPTSVALAPLDEPPGTRIAGVSTAPDRVTLQLQGGGPDRVVVVDTRTGRVLARVALAR